MHNKWRRVTLETFLITITTKMIDKVMLSVWSYFYSKRRCRCTKKESFFLSTSCGIETYRLFKGLTAPAKPVEKTFDELVTLMKNHENLEKVIITYQAFFQCSFGNYPGREFGAWFVFNISLTYFKHRATNYRIYYHCRSQVANRGRYWNID